MEEQSKEEREKAYRETLKSMESQTEQAVEEKEKPLPPPPSGSLGRVKTEMDKMSELHEQNKALFSSVGYRKVDIANLPDKGQFNDPTMRIKIRALTFEEIKHYSALDETDLMDVSEHINQVLAAACKIEYEDHVGTSGDLMEAAKYYLLFAIRDLTMEVHQRYNKLWQRCQCPKCGKKMESEITSHAFSSYTIPKSIIKYYDSEQRKIVINHEAFGDEPLLISPPSIAITKAIQKYMSDHAKKMQQKGMPAYFDAQFMLKLQYLLDSSSQVSEAYLTQLKKKIDGWPDQKLMAFEYVRDNMDVGIRPQLEIICSQAKALATEGNEVWCRDDYSFTAPVIFQYGWRSVFDISGVIGTLFGSDSE